MEKLFSLLRRKDALLPGPSDPRTSSSSSIPTGKAVTPVYMNWGRVRLEETLGLGVALVPTRPVLKRISLGPGKSCLLDLTVRLQLVTVCN